MKPVFADTFIEPVEGEKNLRLRTLSRLNRRCGSVKFLQ
jgi:hypothetical protein